MKYLLITISTFVFMGSAMASGPVSPFDACSAINKSNTFFGNQCVDVVVKADSFSKHAAGACMAIMETGDRNAFYAVRCMENAANAHIEPHAAAICAAIKNSFFAASCMENIANKTMDRGAARFCQQKAENNESAFYVNQCVESIAKDYDPDVVVPDLCLSQEQIYNRVERAKNMLDNGRPQRTKRILNRLLNRLDECL